MPGSRLCIVLLGSLALVGCGGATAPPGPSRSSGANEAPYLETRKDAAQPPRAAASGTRRAATDDTELTPPRHQPGAEPPVPQVSFSPEDFAPPFAQSASPEDGKWTQVGDATAGEVASESPWIFRASVHPHPKSRFVRMDVTAVDLTQVSLHWVIGTDDDGAEKLKPHLTPGLVPSEAQARTLAVFNGGFQARHGRWGMLSHGVVLVPPRDVGCTLVQTPAGDLHLGPWSRLTEETPSVLYLRQGPPCLLDKDTIHPQLLKGQDKLWAGKNADLRTRRRSAVGLNAARTVLFYAVGTETEPLDLARGMSAVGASYALQLDINWNWTRFLIAGRREGLVRVTSTLIPEMAHGKNEYFSRPSQRDFFYLKVK